MAKESESKSKHVVEAKPKEPLDAGNFTDNVEWNAAKEKK